MRVCSSDGASFIPSRSSRSTSSAVTYMSSTSSKGTLLDVVPISEIVSPGTRMSASAGLRQRFSTMLFTLWPKISSEPLAGSMLTVTPALRAMSCPQMPPALTTTCARYSAVWPVLRSSTLTPVMRFCSRRKSSTSW